MIISAYTKDDKIVEGKLEVLPNGQKMVLTESGKVKLDELKYVRFIEDEENQVDKQVKSDIDVIKDDLENKKPDEKTLEDAGEKREKELKDAGMKIEEPDEYKTKFVLQAAAVVGGADGGMDTTKADANNSDAFAGLKESENATQSDLHPDYQTAVPYQDNLTRDQIYLKMKQEIDNYKQDDNNNFDEKALVEHMCNKFVGFNCVGEFKSLKEAFIKIIDNCKLD